MSHAGFRGVFAPVLTPFHDDLTPDVERWIAFSHSLLDDGCHGLCPFGTTSEANSLGLDERMEMLDALVASGVEAARLMPGTATCALPDTVKLTAHAVELGVGGVLMLPPFYYKGVSDDGLFRAVAEVIERVGDDRLRIYLYHIPPVAQVGFSLPLIERLRAAYPTVVVGMKDSSGDWLNMQTTLTELPDFITFPGSEKFLLQGLRLGGAGCISAMANAIPGQLRALYDGWLAENAASMQEEANQLRSQLQGYAPIPALKAIIADRLDTPTWRNVRPPLDALGDVEADDLLARLRATVPAAV